LVITPLHTKANIQGQYIVVALLSSLHYKGECEDYPSYQIIGDNVDLHQRTPHQSMKRKDKDHHWFQMYAVRDRVTGRDLPNNAPIADVTKVPLQTFLPSVEECNHIREEFGVLIARVIVEKLEYFSPLKPVVPEHMKHKYTDLMRLKSDMVGTVCYLTIHIKHLVITGICDKVALHFTNHHYFAGAIGCTHQIRTGWG